jgi:hypothetical protein
MIRRTGRKTLGYRVTATDAVVALVEAARQADSADEYAWKITWLLWKRRGLPSPQYVSQFRTKSPKIAAKEDLVRFIAHRGYKPKVETLIIIHNLCLEEAQYHYRIVWKTSLESANKIQAGSAGNLCYFALRTGTRGMEILMQALPGARRDMATYLFSVLSQSFSLSSFVPDHTVPYGTVLSRDAFPGTSCQATIGVVPPGRAGRHFATASS